MKKVFNWIKKNRSKIFVTWAIIVIAINIFPTNDIIQNNAVFAEINQQDIIQGTGESVLDKIVGLIMNVGTGVLGAPLATIVNVFVLLIFLILYSVFQTMGMTANAISFPFPDQIIFNRIAFFDPNFINPPSVENASGVMVDVADAPVKVMQSVVQNMYYSFFILAGTIFVIAAMVIGIKLALSTLASQKAQYKAALTNWVMGVVLLFTVHFLMAGIFYINEQIVEVAYKASKSGSINFTIDVAEAVGTLAKGGIGRTIGNLVSDMGAAITGNEDWGQLNVGTGYSGYLLSLVIRALTGDFIASIITAIILGQTVSLVITYTKRLFYCIILGMMAPIIVAVDVIKKSIA